ncbi:hypothetical protein DI272_06430 [Streptomyces sp. Act143]|uniref:hypothetical protein n=1 Tax=Streptomyces sp. Act143 TaxID=2200760 RepID=UPI000D681B45|nr:hypothetical protein [Streptomyces sp. Act143]PWI13826.1 hypothetical protein DI272_06430 [Streptomyces sp. Act143]
MGIYLVSVGADEWFAEDGDEYADEGEGEEGGGFGAVATGLNEELRRRGLPPYESVPEDTEFVRGSGAQFEEKLVPPMDGFLGLCSVHLSEEDVDSLCGWTVMVPSPLEEEVELPFESAYSDTTVIAGAPRVLALAERLADAVGLPVDAIPVACDNLDLTTWFLDGPAKETAAARPGPWAEDLDAAFYVALFLRAAQHSLRRGCPIVLT